MTQVFISYSRKDLAFVERLAKDLTTAGWDVWYDLSSLEVGDHWGKEIQFAIQQSQVFLVVLSPNSIDSEWVEREFLYAGNHKLQIIPLVYETCDLPMWTLNMHFFDMRGKKYALCLEELLKVLGKKTGTQSPISMQESITSRHGGVAPAHQKRRFSPIWIIAPLILAVLIALGIWGMPLVTARLAADAATPTVTSTPEKTSTPTRTPPPTVTRTPIPGIGSTWTRPADGMLMVYVPGGGFTMGAFISYYVTLDAFWMDQTEVTNAMYARCVGAGACQPPSTNSSRLRSSYYGDPQYADFPVIHLNWAAAGAYCVWAGARLPTDAEWEKAARGTDWLAYPWGNFDPFCSRGNYNSCQDDTTAVGSYPSGASPYGVLDMAGNVKEWVNDWYDETYEPSERNPQGPTTGTYRVVRSSAYYSDLWYIRTGFRGWFDPNGGDLDLGFRCARSP
jgi:formylglycine-generating enzyme required for sulfatase activity